ncbi:hypothetical protein OSTOST_11617, partial [Ostertagia ostertagi]
KIVESAIGPPPLDGIVTDVWTPEYWDDIVKVELPWMQRETSTYHGTPPKPVIKPVTPPSNDEAVNGGWIPWWNNWYGPMGFPWFVRGDGPTAPVAGTPAECHR